MNVDADLRLGITGAMRRFVVEYLGEFDPRNFFGETVKAMRDLCIARYGAFGAAGSASKIKPISPEAMFQRYARSELAAKVS